MAIGTLHVEWLSSLALRSALPRGASVLELGRQEIWMDRAPMRLVAGRHLDEAGCERAMDAIFAEGAPRPRADAQPALYSVFGASDYRALDFGDATADYQADLNHPLPRGLGRFDVVANFGTTEHVFNIGQSFANIHRLLKPGGLQLHTLQSYGYIDHGFWNVHPCAYIDMARANHYEIVDLQYIDNIFVRMQRPIEAAPFDFASLPIQAADMADTHALMTKVALQFHRNLQSPESRAALESVAPKDRPLPAPKPMPDDQLQVFLLFDMMFAALRRTERSPRDFVVPQQGIYAGPPASKPGPLTRLRRRLGW